MRIKKTPQGIDGYGIIGKVNIGKKSEKGFPMSIDYFSFAVDGKRKSLLTETLGEKPNVLYVNVPTKNCFHHYWELRSKSGDFICKMDDSKMLLANDGFYNYDLNEKGWDANEVRSKLEKKHGTKFKECVTLYFLLNNYPEKGLWLIQTRGVASSIENLLNSIDNNSLPCNFTLSVRKQKGNAIHNKSKQFPVLNLIPVQDQKQLL